MKSVPLFFIDCSMYIDYIFNNCFLYFSYSKLKNTITIVTELLLQDIRNSHHVLTEFILAVTVSLG
jgi:hypothetical protein